MAALTEDQEALLWGTSDEALLTTFASLTHRIDSAKRIGSTGWSPDYRVQRDVVQAEILRRMAGGA